jgi:hypothetical protein
VQVANCNLATGFEIHAADKKYAVVVPGERGEIEYLKWKDVAMDPREDSYIIRATPSSVLSETFGARLGEVERLIAMDPEMTRVERYDLLQMPDTKRKNDQVTSAKDNGEAMIEKALNDGEFTPTSPFMDLDQFLIDANAEEQRATELGVAEPNIATLRRMMRMANVQNQKKKLAKLMNEQAQLTPAVVPTTETGQSSTAMTPTG